MYPRRWLCRPRLGINLALPGAMASLQAALSAMAGLSLPALSIPPVALSSLIGLLAALANIKAGLGVNLMAPNASAALQLALSCAAALRASQPESFRGPSSRRRCRRSRQRRCQLGP